MAAVEASETGEMGPYLDHPGPYFERQEERGEEDQRATTYEPITTNLVSKPGNVLGVSDKLVDRTGESELGCLKVISPMGGGSCILV